MKQPTLVSKDWLRAELARTTHPEYRRSAAEVIGRALVAINNRQEPEERGATIFKNGVGFTGTDARFGTKCAEHFQRTGTLEPYMVRVWTFIMPNGYPRICKYSKQLNEIAKEKASRAQVAC